MKKIILVLFGTAAGVFAATPPPVIDCNAVYGSVKSAVKADKSNVLKIVSAKTMETPSCACEVVKASIDATKPSPMVVSIVEAAALAAPEQLSEIAKCAAEAAPAAADAINAMVTKLTSEVAALPNPLKLTSEVAALPNPLDFPGTGPVGPGPGIASGMPLVPTLPPFVIAPPDVSNINP